jgi:hypothetical protein
MRGYLEAKPARDKKGKSNANNEKQALHEVVYRVSRTGEYAFNNEYPTFLKELNSEEHK